MPEAKHVIQYPYKQAATPKAGVAAMNVEKAYWELREVEKTFTKADIDCCNNLTARINEAISDRLRAGSLSELKFDVELDCLADMAGSLENKDMERFTTRMGCVLTRFKNQGWNARYSYEVDNGEGGYIVVVVHLW